MSIKNIFLDLDNTLISSIKVNPQNQSLINDLKIKCNLNNLIKYYELYDNNQLIYVIFTRPHLESFLDFIFLNFNISIWTAGTRCYASFIIKNILKNRNINYVLFEYHTNISNRLYDKQPKNLNIFNEHFNLPELSIDNTLIIDDNTKISGNSNNLNKNYKSILCTYFDVTKGFDHVKEDKDLLRIIKDLRTNYLSTSNYLFNQTPQSNSQSNFTI